MTGLQAAEFNSSIFFFNIADIQNCEHFIQKSKDFGNSTARFVHTFNFVGSGAEDDIEYYCFNNSEGCKALSPTYSAQIHEGIKQCFQKAFDRGMDVSFLLHVDGSFWRNQLVFDPKETHGEASIYNEHLKPMGELIAAITPQERKIEWELVGEMGATIFHYAQSYREILNELRTILHGKNIKIGVGVNHNRIGGDNFEYTPQQLLQLEELLREIDFLGISAYTPQVLSELGAASFYKNVTRVKKEFSDYGVQFPAAKDILFAEVGLGGACDKTHSGQNYESCDDPAQAVDSPWAGVSGPYNSSLDPWQNEEMRAVRLLYHQSLLELLANQENFEHRILGAYMWNLSSWDAQGFTTSEYGDSAIQELIRKHNETH